MQVWKHECLGIDQPHLVERTVLVIGGEGVLLQVVILQEASCLQNNLVILSQGVLHNTSKRALQWWLQARSRQLPKRCMNGLSDKDSFDSLLPRCLARMQKVSASEALSCTVSSRAIVACCAQASRGSTATTTLPKRGMSPSPSMPMTCSKHLNRPRRWCIWIWLDGILCL